jgi:hypothetical protein
VSALFSEMSCEIFGGTPSVLKFIVDFATREQWYGIEKVRFFLFLLQRSGFVVVVNN